MEMDRHINAIARPASPPEEPPPKETQRARKKNFLVVDTIAKYALQGYLFTITATWYLGMFEVMPVLCKDSGEDVLFLQRCFMTLIFVEANGNWLCIRYVDSSFFYYLKKKSRQSKNCLEDGGGSSGSKFTLKSEEFSPSNGENSSDLSENSLSSTFENENSGFSKDRGTNKVEGDKNGVTRAEQGRLHGDDCKSGQGQSVSNISKGQALVVPECDWKPVFKPRQQSSYPYWSWIPCYICEVMRPPRCHHCPVCHTCVLKRDHHCYFAGACVGWRNQRHFIVFLVWVGIGACYATLNSYSFFKSELWPAMTAFDLLFPVCIARWVFGYVSGLTCICVILQTLLIYFILLISSFVFEHMRLIKSGLTSFEVSSLKNTVQIQDTKTIGAKIRATMGRQWFLNFIFPVHWVFEADEDPENWPSIKVYRHGKTHSAAPR